VVELVGTGVIQILALEMDLHAARRVAQAACVVQGRRTPDEILPEPFQLLPELRIPGRTLIGDAQLVERGDERFGDEATSERAEAVGREVRRGRYCHRHALR